MSVFNELILPKLNEICHNYVKNFNNDLQAAFDTIRKFELDFENERKTRDTKSKIPVTNLQSIHEDEDENSPKTTEKLENQSNGNSKNEISSQKQKEEARASKKRSKDEVDGMSSPEVDKRQKRNASVRAQSQISKQVNVNLTQKLRRDESDAPRASRSRRRKDDDKENAEPVLVQVKQEKISVAPEPMDTDTLICNVEVKQEVDKDGFTMPQPVAPIPKPRKALQKGIEKTEKAEVPEESSGRSRRSTRTRKQTDTMPPPPVPAERSVRASSRNKKAESEEKEKETVAEGRPKRTRGKKKVSESANTESEKETSQSTQGDISTSPEVPRSKRTRRGKKAAVKEEPKPEEIQQKEPETKSPKKECVTEVEDSNQSPILTLKNMKKHKNNQQKVKSLEKSQSIDEKSADKPAEEKKCEMNATITISKDMNSTMVLANGVYNHDPVTPQNMREKDATIVLDNNRETIVLEKHNHAMDSTVVIDKVSQKSSNPTEELHDSLLTDDESEYEGTPKNAAPIQQPTSAVKEKVQQFEELATRVTRTKTRAMAKQDDPTESQTPPDKICKVVLSAETLTKMDSMIFNGKTAQVSKSVSKPRANVTTTKSYIPSSTSKITALSKAKEAAEESLLKEKEDARKKKEAMLEAKREMHKRKREEKMVAAALAREAAEKERKAALEQAVRERQEKQAHADLGKVNRLKEIEKKKQELARKVAENEERRKAEEVARQKRLELEQLRAEELRKRQLDEAQRMKREEMMMAKEYEMRQKEFIEKQKQKKLEKAATPLKSVTCLSEMSPVYMADGFEHLNSDEEEETARRPRPPAWCSSENRRLQLAVQEKLSPAHVDRLFSVRSRSVDLRALFPALDSRVLKRTSSAVWRTPPQRT